MSEVAAPTAPEPSFREQVEQATAAEPQVTAQPEQSQEAPNQDAANDQEAAPETAEKVEKVVPLAALHEERRRRQELQRQHEEASRNFIALQQQQVALMQELQRRANPPPAPINPAEDPLGAQYQATQALQAEMQALRQGMTQQQQEAQARAQVEQFSRAVQAGEAAFAAAHPDYLESVSWLKGLKAKEYQAAGMTEREAFEAVQRDAWQLSQACLQRGESPAERAYEIAKTLGYKPQGNAQDKLAMQQAGTRASTPSNGAGQGGGRVSLEALAKMGPKEFLKATEGDNWKKLMGKM